ncbi:MAG: DegT/DnrJ/EryC1/StrS family aminotransferase [Candidatus Omnitrophica bacterium]|nr:DegT/DnrJ/EryC1/StrS family aminotransferase [Candidatus Omnitrophota bacterium]
MSKLAINGGSPIRGKKPWPSWPIHDEREKKALLKVLDGNWWYGERVKEFEEKFADFQDAKYGITVTNGTAALEVSLICAGIGAGDEVIVPAYSFIATATAVIKANAIPVFCDIEEDTFNIDIEKIEGLITDKTKAIIPVHMGGLPCDMDRILSIAKKHKLKVIEDACHSWGSQWKGKGTGAIGDGGVFSFQRSKNITSGEGGIILSDNEEFADLCRSYCNCGRVKDKPWYEHYIPGGNYRITEFQAAILLAQLTRLKRQTEVRAKNAGYLNQRLAGIPGVEVLRNDPRVTRRSYHLYIFRYIAEEFDNVPRAKFIEALNAEGIPASAGYPHPLYKNPLFANKGKGAGECQIFSSLCGSKIDYTRLNLPVVERLCAKEAIWFVQSMLLGTRKDMEDIVTAMEKIRNNTKELA